MKRLMTMMFLMVVGVASWNYDDNGPEGPSNWWKFNSICNGTRQSPVDIDTIAAVYKSSLQPLQLGNYKNTDKLVNVSMELLNNGHALQVNMLRNDRQDLNPIVTVYDGHSWSLAQFHFHWGKNNSRGGEHTIDNKEYAAEVHFVHYNTKYLSLGEAADKADGLLVWGTLLKIGNANKGLDRFLNLFDKVKYKKQKEIIAAFPLTELVPQDSVSDYYTYDGSLTTPPCYQSVKWVVNREFITITQEQLNKFRTLRSTINATGAHELSDTHRPPQKLYGRKIYRSFDSSSTFVMASVFSLLCPLLNTLVRV